MTDRQSLVRAEAAILLQPARPAAPASATWLRTLWRSLLFRFLVIVAAPTLAATAYYGFVATGRYVSYASYIVRGVNSHNAGGIGALLNTIGISRTADDGSAVEDFIASRDALQQVDAKLNLRVLYSLPGVDFLSRYPRPWERDTFERLYARTQNYISVAQDQATGIATLTVQAFRPEDAQAIAAMLMSLAEGVVNKMNARAEVDSIRASKDEVAEAHRAVLDGEDALTVFRNKEFLVDPTSYAAVLLETIGSLTRDRAQAQVDLAHATALSPANPSITGLQAKITGLEQKITDERSGLAGTDAAMADKVATFDRLTLDRKLSEKRYENALMTYQAAQQEAQRQQVYLEATVSPNLPDEATEPQRGRSILTVFVVAFAIFSMVWILSVGARDHAQ